MSVARTQSSIRSGHRPQKVVAGVVPQTVVDILEIVEVDEDDGRPAVVTFGEQQRLGQAVLEQGAVRQFGQGVMGRHELDALLGELALDGDAGDFGGDVDQARFGFARLAHLLRIQRKRPQHLFLMRQDRRRPAGANPVRGREIQVGRPTRIDRDVGDDDRLPRVGSGAAGAHIGSDLEAVDGR